MRRNVTGWLTCTSKCEPQIPNYLVKISIAKQQNKPIYLKYVQNIISYTTKCTVITIFIQQTRYAQNGEFKYSTIYQKLFQQLVLDTSINSRICGLAGAMSTNVKQFLWFEEIHSVGTVNNIETSYFTQLRMCYLMTTFRCPSDILITSWLFTAWWNFVVHPKDKVKDEETELIYCVPCNTCSSSYAGETGRKFGLRIKKHKKEVDSFTAGTHTRASRARECSVTQVSHHKPCRGKEPCHRLGQGKSGRQRGTATDQMDKRGILDQKDTDMHELGCRILPTQPHMGPGNFQVTCSIEL